MRDRIVARVLIDSTWRDIFEQPDGRQYVLDDDDEPVYGVWFMPREMPEPDAVVDGRAKGERSARPSTSGQKTVNRKTFALRRVGEDPVWNRFTGR